MSNSKKLKEKMDNKISAARHGRLFAVSDFLDLGNANSIYKYLGDFEQEGRLIRIYRGIYQKPNYNELLKMNILPSATQVAEVLAKKNHWKIAPAKDLALNSLGLDTQVSNQFDFISSGPTKKIKLEDGRELNFRQVTQREVLLHPTSALVIEAFKQLGEGNIGERELKIVRRQLTDQQMKRLIRDSENSRLWIREKIRKMEELSND